MTDIVERLRNEASIWISSRTSYDLLNDAVAEIERLRNVAQGAQDLVDRARDILSAIDLSWLEAFDRGPDADYGGISLGDDHKTFWRHAISFLEASGGRPPPPEEVTESELMDALDVAYPALPSAERACVCQEQHRRGYCTEPGCPHAQQQRQP